MAVMTSKERITVAMRGGTPDQVPVTPGLSEIIPVQKFTNDYIEFFMKAQIPLWKARVEVESDYFGADSFLHVAPDASPEDPEFVQTVTKETADEMFFTRTHRTAAGDLTADYYIARTAPVSIALSSPIWTAIFPRSASCSSTPAQRTSTTWPRPIPRSATEPMSASGCQCPSTGGSDCGASRR